MLKWRLSCGSEANEEEMARAVQHVRRFVERFRRDDVVPTTCIARNRVRSGGKRTWPLSGAEPHEVRQFDLTRRTRELGSDLDTQNCPPPLCRPSTRLFTSP